MGGASRLWALKVDQVRFGHACRKRTWLLLAGVPFSAFPDRPPPRQPTHFICGSRASRAAMRERGMRATGAEVARRTPPAFARLLILLAQSASRLKFNDGQ